MTLGQKIKELRLKRNLSVDVFAGLIGVTRQNVYAYENDKIRPKPEKIRTIATVLHTTEVDLLQNISGTGIEKTESWYQAEITRLNRIIEMLSQAQQSLTSQLGKLEGTKMLPIEVDTTPLSLVA